jgi:hypothetical protein
MRGTPSKVIEQSANPLSWRDVHGARLRLWAYKPTQVKHLISINIGVPH